MIRKEIFSFFPRVKDDLILFQNNTEEEFEASMQNCLHILEEAMKG